MSRNCFTATRTIAGSLPAWRNTTTNAEIEAVATALLEQLQWDGVDSYAAKDEDDAWNYAGEIPGFQNISDKPRNYRTGARQ
ncbi:MAG: hypothetical protein ACLTDO_09825 [Bifidobacterium pseudocatenulatum]